MCTPEVENHYSKNIMLFIPYVTRLHPRSFVLLEFFQMVSLFSSCIDDCMLLLTIPRVRLVCLFGFFFPQEKHTTAKQLVEAERSRMVWRDALQHLTGRPTSQNVTLGICWLLSYLILVTRSWTKNKQWKINLQPPSCDWNMLRFCLTWHLSCI